MADLKDFDEKQLFDAVTKAGRRAQESVETTAQQILEEIREVVNAQTHLPKRLDDLLASSHGFWVKEFLLDGSYGDNSDIPMRNISIQIGGRRIDVMPSSDYDDREVRCLVKKKHYRAILIFQEVE
jgi:hypothetical protein